MQTFISMEEMTTDTTFRSPDLVTLDGWFSALHQFQRISASAEEFFAEALRLICEPGGLETGRLFLLKNDVWESQQATEAPNTFADDQETALLEEMECHRQTCFHSSLLNRNLLEEGTSVVISPILNKSGIIIGALWGERRVYSGNQRRGIRELEARWVQLLSEAISSGLIRLEEEQHHARTRLLLDQVFPKSVTRQLMSDDSLLKAQRREITLLFADLQRSTVLFKQLEPSVAYELLSELMEVFTAAAVDQFGVLIDYYGDGLAVMWNAPVDQSDHALLACRAAMAMQKSVEEISMRWQPKLEQPLRLGIGIHTGEALVGNSGSQRRIKYGPRGEAVVVASRLESATRPMQASILLSHETVQQLPAESITRRLCQVRLPNMSDAHSVYELCSLNGAELSPDEHDFIQQYERIVALYESQQLAEACLQLTELEQQTLSNRYSVRFLSEHVSALTRTDRQRRQNDKKRDQMNDPAILLELK
ncbi:adenylate/guanylate cyclase domain-containing protein [Polystyrenella longa]|uniref:adenylate/guanylate cyclase domain-containing protein n=1 Tax=Polystyrenella longa TaxID=2528007 RepID=UPI0018D252E0|nr:adenylate/guanylate cyclase domain-containing protein [Polystyrenella longa]